jgi:hypothetical protein
LPAPHKEAGLRGRLTGGPLPRKAVYSGLLSAGCVCEAVALASQSALRIAAFYHKKEEAARGLWARRLACQLASPAVCAYPPPLS